MAPIKSKLCCGALMYVLRCLNMLNARDLRWLQSHRSNTRPVTISAHIRASKNTTKMKNLTSEFVRRVCDLHAVDQRQ